MQNKGVCALRNRLPGRGARLAIAGAVTSAFLTVGLAAPASAAPSPTACTNRTNDSLAKLLECVRIEGVRAHQQALQRIASANGNTRVSSSAGYDLSVEYVRSVLRQAGYQVTLQSFDFDYFDDNSTMEQTSPAPTTYEVLVDFAAAQFSPIESVTGTVQGVDLVLPPGPAPNTSSSGCNESGNNDFAGFTPGNIALLQRGTCAFTVKALNAQAAGATGVILFNEGQPPPPEDRTGLIIPIGNAPGLTIPVVATTFAIGNALAASSPPAVVSLDVDYINEVRTTNNVIAERPGRDPSKVVMVGAHLDSVPEGPGINDNGSGSAAILEVARLMAKSRPLNTVRFAFWGAEEFGLFGSQFYVDDLAANAPEELERIALYLNFDMIGSPNFVRFIYDGDGSDHGTAGPPGSGEIEALFRQFYESRGVASETTPFDGRSDYGPFIADGIDIPAGGLFTGAEAHKTAEQARIYGGTVGEQLDPCYHQACDTFSNVNLGVLDLNADAVAYTTFTYAMATTLP
jgi:Zn-dependent M28 family amino/carboxypeptidase